MQTTCVNKWAERNSLWLQLVQTVQHAKNTQLESVDSIDHHTAEEALNLQNVENGKLGMKNNLCWKTSLQKDILRLVFQPQRTGGATDYVDIKTIHGQVGSNNLLCLIWYLIYYMFS